MIRRCSLSGVMLLSLLLFLSSLFPFSVYAEDAVVKPADVRVIIDISGSMKQSDPDNLRIPALNLLVELLPDGSQAGVWTFGRYVNMLVPLATVNPAWRQQAKQAATEINSVGLQTNLTEAMEKASWKIKPDSGFDHSVILLTDGKIDMRSAGMAADINDQQRQRLLTQVLPSYIEAGARVHTVALSDAADEKMLQQIALETGGLFLKADNADDLLKAFLKAFDRAVPAEQVPMDGNQFDIDDSVREFTALIFRKAGAGETGLQTPDGEVITETTSRQLDSVRWHSDLNFDLITVRQPRSGSWSVQADIDPDNRVQILTDMKLRVTGLPETIFVGYPIDLTMALTEKGEVIAAAEILSLTDVSLKVTAPDGRTGSKLLSDPEVLPEDGVFRESLTRLSQQGEYQIEVLAQGRTFKRKQLLTTRLMEPMEVAVTPDVAQQQLAVRVSPQVEHIDTALSRVIARITSPDSSSVIQSMEFDARQNSWLLLLEGEKGPGQYDILLNIRGVTANGSTFKTKPENIVAEFPLTLPGEAQPQVGEAATLLADEVAEPAADNVVTDAADDVAVEENIAAEPVNEAPSEPAVEAAADTEEAGEDESITPDLTEKYQQQEAGRQSEENDEDVAEEPATEGVAWWIYLLLAVGNLAVFGGVGYWWFARRKALPGQAAAGQPEHRLPPDLEVDDLDEEDFSGDFDAFDDDSEEEIPAKPGPAPAMGGGADDGLSLDDDFAIDPDDGDADMREDWGEFDDPEEGDKNT